MNWYKRCLSQAFVNLPWLGLKILADCVLPKHYPYPFRLGMFFCLEGCSMKPLPSGISKICTSTCMLDTKAKNNLLFGWWGGEGWMFGNAFNEKLNWKIQEKASIYNLLAYNVSYLLLGLQVSSCITLWVLLVKLGLLFLWGSLLLPVLLKLAPRCLEN